MIRFPGSASKTANVSKYPSGCLIMTNNCSDDWSATIGQHPKVIGRSSGCEIRVPARFTSVSRRHAEVYADRHGLKIRDLGSRSGTRVNGVWIQHPREAILEPGDHIWIGSVRLEVALKVPVPAWRAAADDSSEADVEEGGSLGQPLPVRLSELSQAELAIVLWMARGYFKDEEIAGKLFRSPNTVRTQVNSIFRKLNVRSRTDIIGLLKGCQH